MTAREEAILWLNSFVKNKEPMTLIPKQLIRLMYDALKEQPDVVRCKDCNYGKHIVSTVGGEVTIYRIFCTKPYVERGNATHEPDWFCADGKRKG